MKAQLMIALMACFFFACNKPATTFQVEGTLTGPDLALCSCCGGVILEINNQTGNFRIDSLPLMSVQKLHSLAFPQKIVFDYSRKDSCAGIQRFAVTSYFVGN